ncbi:uncharacterized protein LOC143904619 isoform X2 [Temnothorax americanus]|uniref:uncharacterized protein LOC143904619 isoform X2 n=1 Tax=Temnothorax americanus TaxID=1964332 RepID=UPI0040682F4E
MYKKNLEWKKLKRKIDQNKEWKKLKRKCDLNLNSLVQEEYVDHIVKKSTYNDFNKQNCNTKQQSIHEDNTNKDFMPEDHNHPSNYIRQFATQEDLQEAAQTP